MSSYGINKHVYAMFKFVLIAFTFALYNNARECAYKAYLSDVLDFLL